MLHRFREGKELYEHASDPLKTSEDLPLDKNYLTKKRKELAQLAILCTNDNGGQNMKISTNDHEYERMMSTVSGIFEKVATMETNANNNY